MLLRESGLRPVARCTAYCGVRIQRFVEDPACRRSSFGRIPRRETIIVDVATTYNHLPRVEGFEPTRPATGRKWYSRVKTEASRMSADPL